MPGDLFVSLLRALSIATVLAALAPAVQRALCGRRWLWIVLLLPLVTPSVVVGFAYVERLPPGWPDGCLYAFLLAARLLPVAVVLQVLLPPPPLSPPARHCGGLLGRRPAGSLRHGPLRNALVVGAMSFVLAFQEFELASLLGARAWTVWLCDAQAGGLPLADTLAAVSWPAGLEVLVLLGALRLFRRTDPGQPRPPAFTPGGNGWVWPVAATLLASVLPVLALLQGVGDLGGQLHLGAEIGSSVVLACGAVLAASLVVALLPWPALWFLCLPGMTGGLVLGICVQALFQLPGLAALYDTPLPLLLAWVLLLLPAAVVLRLALALFCPGPALHLAALLGDGGGAAQRRQAARLRFTLRGSRLGLGTALLLSLALFEVVSGNLLAPSNMTPAAPRLYNLMHYGRSAGLAAMLIMLAAAAFACGSLPLLCYRLMPRLDPHAQ